MKPPSYLALLAIDCILTYFVVEGSLFYVGPHSENLVFNAIPLRTCGNAFYYAAVFLVTLHTFITAPLTMPPNEDTAIFNAAILIGCPLGLVMVKFTSETLKWVVALIQKAAKPYLRNIFTMILGTILLLTTTAVGTLVFLYYQVWTYMAIYFQCFSMFAFKNGFCPTLQRFMITEHGSIIMKFVFRLSGLIAMTISFYSISRMFWSIMARIPCVPKPAPAEKKPDTRPLLPLFRRPGPRVVLPEGLVYLYGRRTRAPPGRRCRCGNHSEAYANPNAPARPHRPYPARTAQEDIIDPTPVNA